MQEHLCKKLETAMHLISKRWVGLILFELCKGPRRFSEMEANLPVSGRLLSERLKMLEREEMVNRSVYTEYPVRIEYSLTEKGHAIQPVISELEKWAEEWMLVEEHEYSR